MVDVVEDQSLLNRLDSVDSGISDEPDSASSVSSDWFSMFGPISSSMVDFVGGQSSSFLVAGEGRPCPSLEKVQAIAFELAFDLVLHTTGKVTKPVNRHCHTLRRLCHELSTKHEILFASLVKKLDLTDNDLDCRFLENVAGQMFSDQEYNWGRIVTFYAFAAWLARHCVENRLNPQYPDRIAHKTGKFVAENVSNWIIKHGGWDAMDELFKESDNLESKMWKGLLCTVLGFGALATAVAVSR